MRERMCVFRVAQASRPVVRWSWRRGMCLAPGHSGVAQVSNLLYRRFPIGRLPTARTRRTIRPTRRLEALRYSRLETCATLNTYPIRWGEGRGEGSLIETFDALYSSS